MRVAVLAVPGLDIFYCQRCAIIHFYQRRRQQSHQYLRQDEQPITQRIPDPQLQCRCQGVYNPNRQQWPQTSFQKLRPLTYPS